MAHFILTALLCSVIAVLSFYAGRQVQRRSFRRRFSLSKHYFAGLNYLLNEQPDKAVDAFIRMIDTDTETLQIQVAIGSLFRRQGEVSRAIRVHQNLVSHPRLSRSMRIQALIELGRDYLSAGLYDRAERLFLEAIDTEGKSASSAIRYLLSIYQDEKEWEKAIYYARLLESQRKESAGHLIANYYCGLIEEKLISMTDVQFQTYLKAALAADPRCVRASLLEASWHERHGDYRAAIKAYRRIKDQDPEYIAETIKSITACYERLHDEAGLRDYLYQCLNDAPQLPVILMITRKLEEWHGRKVAADFIATQLNTYPSLQGLTLLAEFYLQESSSACQPALKTLHHLMHHFLRDIAGYQCKICGFMAKKMEWLCPGCKHWNTIKPIQRLEQEFAK